MYIELTGPFCLVLSLVCNFRFQLYNLIAYNLVRCFAKSVHYFSSRSFSDGYEAAEALAGPVASQGDVLLLFFFEYQTR